jgi:hypothetical protein
LAGRIAAGRIAAGRIAAGRIRTSERDETFRSVPGLDLFQG